MNSVSDSTFNSVLRRNMVVIAAVLGACAVLAGAFGAHALRDELSPRMLDVWATAVRYQMWHALALLAVAALCDGRVAAQLRWLPLIWGLGALLFSGSLYLLALSKISLFGLITPLGGLLLVVGWGQVAFTFWRRG